MANQALRELNNNSTCEEAMQHKPNPDKIFVPSWPGESPPAPGYIDAAEDMALDGVPETPINISAEEFDKLVLTELPDWLEGDLRERIAKATNIVEPLAKQAPEQPKIEVLARYVAVELRRSLASPPTKRPKHSYAISRESNQATAGAFL
jgi:hypothetical protein